jgi:hypothetical protein
MTEGTAMEGTEGTEKASTQRNGETEIRKAWWVGGEQTGLRRG